MPVRAETALDLPALEASVRASMERWVEDLGALVAIDSGSYSPDGVNATADVMERWLREDGWTVERSPCGPPGEGTELGDILVARLHGKGGRKVLLVGHTDTVFDDGVAAERPLRVEGGRAYGPGVCDMKGGLLVGLAAVRALREVGFDRYGELTFVVNPDEEIGSPGSTPVIIREATRHDVAFVLEAAREDGAIVSARKGVTTGLIRLSGRAAHAGVEPERGRNALAAAARLLLAVQELGDPEAGTTVNVGVLRGGTRSNVVPERAEMELEIRAAAAASQDAVEAEVRRLVAEPRADGVEAGVVLTREHAPMERTPAIDRLVARAVEIAGELGFELHDAATGGASDANTIAGLGVPTLDGLGPIGGDDHSDREWIDVEAVPSRVALLAGLIATVTDPEVEPG